MADIVYRGNLKAASFPFLSELFGRSVIVKQQDQNYIGGLAAKETLDSSIGVPQIYYCHNVVPIDNGYKSVGYIDYSAAAFPSTANFQAALTIRDGAGESALITTDEVGNFYFMNAGSSTWSIPTGAPSAASIKGKRITTAFVSGITYIYFEKVGCYFYDWGTTQLVSVTLTGITAGDILGIAGNAGYLLCYSIDAIAWSSVIDPTDFVPSLETGAGGGSVEGVRGDIVAIEEVYGGLIVFARDNAVAASYSGNPRFPYNFTQITGCGGLIDPDNTAKDTGSGTIYAYTTSGLQSVTLRNATTIMPEVTDFISGSLLEDFNELTNELYTIDASGTQLEKRLALIADRYLILSYGIGKLTHALYHDLSYKQFGRLKVDHVDCFEFTSYSSGAVEVPKKSIAFLGSGGSIQILNSDINADESNGVMILGKFQLVRSRLLQLQGVEFENVQTGDTFNLYDFPSHDGKTFLSPIEGYLASSSGLTRKYNFHTTALNHSILCKGAFTAVSFILSFNVSGAR
jgi:hypothetical protein